MAGRSELAILPRKVQGELRFFALFRQIVLQFENAISPPIIGCPFCRRQSAEDFVGAYLGLLFAKML